MVGLPFLVTLLGLAVFVLLAYAIASTVRDFRAGRRGWGIVGLVAILFGVAPMFVPIETHAVKIDLNR